MRKITVSAALLCIFAVIMTFFIIPVNAAGNRPDRTSSTSESTDTSTSEELTEDTLAPTDNRTENRQQEHPSRDPNTQHTRETKTQVNPSDAGKTTTTLPDSSTGNENTVTTVTGSSADTTAESSGTPESSTERGTTATRAYDVTTYRAGDNPSAGVRHTYTTTPVEDDYVQPQIITDYVSVPTEVLVSSGDYIQTDYNYSYSSFVLDSTEESSSLQDGQETAKHVSNKIYTALLCAVGILVIVSAASFVMYRKQQETA